jgi:hypothetical protein
MVMRKLFFLVFSFNCLNSVGQNFSLNQLVLMLKDSKQLERSMLTNGFVSLDKSERAECFYDYWKNPQDQVLEFRDQLGWCVINKAYTDISKYVDLKSKKIRHKGPPSYKLDSVYTLYNLYEDTWRFWDFALGYDSDFETAVCWVNSHVYILDWYIQHNKVSQERHVSRELVITSYDLAFSRKIIEELNRVGQYSELDDFWKFKFNDVNIEAKNIEGGGVELKFSFYKESQRN